jgi:hypothetical protein
MINIDTTNFKHGVRTSISLGGKRINLETTSVAPPDQVFINITNILTQDSESVIVENYNQKIVRSQHYKKILKPGNFSTKPYTNFIPRIGPKSPKWEGPQPDFQEFSLEFKSLGSNYTENNQDIRSSKQFSSLLNKYLNNEYKKEDLELNLGLIRYKNINNQWTDATNPEKDYFDCYGYAMGSIPTEQKQIELESKTGNRGTIVPHALNLDIVFTSPIIKFKSKNKVNLQSYRLLNNNDIEPKKCNNFPVPSQYKR